ncbi:hypothetical protein H1164_02645 [Thermoactinomyces daqus]|uniref:Aldehyde dehydrogenase domain-containing protein n=1 Tax=Thermoactinomyces daqus TaxID=1329516 RepID=A0A7W2AGM2_9BACL|nr:hypothetical protein [Thermoactinomyces daqus]
MREFGLFIEGKWVSAKSNALFDLTGPATGEVAGRVVDAAPEDVKKATMTRLIFFCGIAKKQNAFMEKPFWPPIPASACL